MSSLQLQERSWLYRNTANFVTTLRLLLTSWLIYLAAWETGRIILMCLLAFLCATSDTLDGYLARRMSIVSKVGASLDRIADKFFICPLIIFMAWGYWPGDIPPWLRTSSQVIVGAIVLLETILTVSWLLGIFWGKNVSSNRSGKIKMTLESVAVTLWFVCLAAHKYWQTEMFLPLAATSFILLAAIYYAAYSLKGYYKVFSDKS